ncbi:hypothetical protein [Acinetobacter lactucae]|uniref:hypothetical protein n=1 Tax=Acinetobacter lactucae TaxID=1785128 RepID=UPI000F77C895|nr:hypothetical protein [Acinetobacter lactucae]RSO39267.1 hypothetical protein EA763_00680 [Acinetobacter lactucae]
MKKNRICLEIVRHKLKRYRKEHPFIFLSLILYLGGLIIYAAIFNLVFSDPRKPMPLNEIGDFLSGVFAPLAFLFLYLGYKQQGYELKQNTKALNLQAAELKNSVEQQEELVKATREELDLIKQQHLDQFKKELVLRQPYFHCTACRINITDPERVSIYNMPNLKSEDKELKVEFDFTNSRSIARDVRVSISVHSKGIVSGQVISFFQSGELKSLNFKLPFPDCFIDEKLEGLINFSYLDELDERQTQSFKFIINQNKVMNKYPRQIYLYDKSY